MTVDPGYTWKWGTHGNGVHMEMGHTWKWGTHGSGAHMEVGHTWKWGTHDCGPGAHMEMRPGSDQALVY